MTNLKIRALIFGLALIASFALITLTSVANAETKTRKKTVTITTTEKDLDEDDEVMEDLGIKTTAEPKERESIATARFGAKPGQSGTSGCKTEDLSKDVIKDLKSDCNAWVKDQKAELKSRFLTSSCEEACEDCGMSLKRCAVNGSVKYILK